MSSVNKVILIGNLGADPEVKQTQGGNAVCSLRIATSDSWNDKDGTKQERTEWHTVTAWGKTAELCGQYLAKGRSVYVEGRLQSREYDDKEGVKRKVWEVVASNVVFLGARGEGGEGGGSRGNGGGGNGGGGGQQGGGGGRTGGGWGGGGGGGGQQGGNRAGGGGGSWGGQQGNRGGGGGGGQQGYDDDPIPF